MTLIILVYIQLQNLQNLWNFKYGRRYTQKYTTYDNVCKKDIRINWRKLDKFVKCMKYMTKGRPEIEFKISLLVKNYYYVSITLPVNFLKIAFNYKYQCSLALNPCIYLGLTHFKKVQTTTSGLLFIFIFSQCLRA